MSPAPLCVAAFAPELAAITSQKRAVGIGLIAASRGAALAVAELQPSVVVLVGTCGAYRQSSLSIGDVIIGTRFNLASVAEALGFGAVVDGTASMLYSEVGRTDSFVALGAIRASVATTLAITTDDAAALSLAGHYGCDVEHLEAHAVAEACASAKVPFACVLGVTNEVGSKGRAQWREHRVRVEARVGAIVERWLRNPS